MSIAHQLLQITGAHDGTLEQEASVQNRPSSTQITAFPTHEPFWHSSFVVQASPSEQPLAPSCTLALMQLPPLQVTVQGVE